MSESVDIHGEAGGSHLCLFCGAVYGCMIAHEVPRWPRLPGARCCPDCRNANLVSLARWEQRRREALYV